MTFSQNMFPGLCIHKKKIIASLILAMLGFIVLPASIHPNSGSITKCNPRISEIIANILPMSESNSSIFMMYNHNDSNVMYKKMLFLNHSN